MFRATDRVLSPGGPRLRPSHLQLSVEFCPGQSPFQGHDLPAAVHSRNIPLSNQGYGKWQNETFRFIEQICRSVRIVIGSFKLAFRATRYRQPLARNLSAIVMRMRWA
jgi:hypothetical protein